jgi:hypothetical protein
MIYYPLGSYLNSLLDKLFRTRFFSDEVFTNKVIILLYLVGVTLAICLR